MSTSEKDLFSLDNKTILVTGAPAASAKPFRSASRGQAQQ